jgi:alanyl-tRNA synthetase
MQTERIYYKFASAAPLEAEILELRPSGDGNTQILLDKTIFYPEGGGQPCDRGTINGIPLLGVREKDGEILHLVSPEEAGKLRQGPVELVLDTRRRRDLTTLHTGQHLLSGIIFRMTGAETVSLHMGDETCTIDVDTRLNSSSGAITINDEILIGIEEAVADAIEENHPVTIHLCPPEDISSFPLRKLPPQKEEVIHVVEIKGYDCMRRVHTVGMYPETNTLPKQPTLGLVDCVACCGTHLKSTAEIGMLRIFGAEKYKGMTRITFIAGHRLLRDSRLLRQNAVVVSRALNVPVGEIGKGVLDFLEKTAQTEKRLKALEEKVVLERVELLLKAVDAAKSGDTSSGPAVVVENYSDIGIDTVLSIGKIAQKQTQAALILASEQDLKFTAFCSTKSFDLRLFLKDAFEAQAGRGGGGPSFFQGSFGTKEALNAFLHSVNL